MRKNSKLDLVGGDFYLISLTQKVSSSAHIEFHARIILQKFIQRSLIKISNEIIEDSFDETKDVFDLLDKAETRLYEVTQGNIKKSTARCARLPVCPAAGLLTIERAYDHMRGSASTLDPVQDTTHERQAQNTKHNTRNTTHNAQSTKHKTQYTWNECQWP